MTLPQEVDALAVLLERWEGTEARLSELGADLPAIVDDVGQYPAPTLEAMLEVETARLWHAEDYRPGPPLW